ncbi:MAG: S8 family serine peptidase [Coriobacteriales bacterium]|nr:S8 family serine peptidase [Coriobacteriales bacterium]
MKRQRYIISGLLTFVLVASLLFVGAPQIGAQNNSSYAGVGAAGLSEVLDALAAGLPTEPEPASQEGNTGGSGGLSNTGNGGGSGGFGGAGSSGSSTGPGGYRDDQIIVVFADSEHLNTDIETLASDMDALAEELQNEGDGSDASSSSDESSDESDNSGQNTSNSDDADGTNDTNDANDANAENDAPAGADDNTGEADETDETTETENDENTYVKLITEDKEIGNVAVVELPEIVDVEAALAEALKNPAVTAAFPNYYLQLFDDVPVDEPVDETTEEADENSETNNENQSVETSEPETTEAPDTDAGTAEAQLDDPSSAPAQDDEPIEPLVTTVNDPGMLPNGKQFAPHLIKAPQAWDYIRTNKTVTVAVIDTGTRLDHEDLAVNIDTTNAWDIPNAQRLATSVAQGKVPYGGDVDNHGTHVAGIIAAASNNNKGISGVSYNATLLPVCVWAYDTNRKVSLGATMDYLYSALNYLNNLKASGKAPNLRVINMSLGVYLNPIYNLDAAAINTLQAYITRAEGLGMLSVAAAGNDATTSLSYPSDLSNVVSVTSVRHDRSIAPYSDHNSYKDIAAPGGHITQTDESKEIYSTFPTTNASYKYARGTSMASPAVAGVAALIWAVNPNLTPLQARTILYDTADRTGFPVNLGYGRGIVDAEKAVRATFITGPATINLFLGYSTATVGYVIPSASTMSIDTSKPNTAKATANNSNRRLTIPAGLGLGSYKVTIRATGSSHPVVTKEITVNVCTRPTISGDASVINLTEGYKAVSRSYAFGGVPTPGVSLTNSKGLKATLNKPPTSSNGVLTIPAGLKKGTYTATITARNIAATTSVPITIKVSRVDYSGLRTIGVGKKTLGVQNKSTSSKANIELQTVNYGPEQRFRFTRVESASTKDYYIITDVLSNKTLEVSDKLADGTLVWQNKTTKKKDQRFSIVKNPGGGYWISPKGSSLVLSLKNGKTSTGAKLVLAKKSKTAKAQRLKLPAIKQPLANGTYTFAGDASGKALEVKNLKANAPLRLNKAKGSAQTQKFKLKYNKKTGYYTITPVSSKLVLDIKGSSTATKSSVQLAKAKSSSYSQKWYLKKTSGGTYTLINAKSGKALEPKGKSKKNKTPVLINNVKNTNAQKWKLKKE